jgi:uncharacterized protein (TIGR03032 family)
VAQERETSTERDRADVPLAPSQPAADSERPPIEQPVFIVAPPRSGATLLFATLGRSPSVWTLGREGHALLERIAEFQPANRDHESNRLTAEDAQPQIAEGLRAAFFAGLRNRDGLAAPEGAAGLRMLQETPRNALRVPFLNAVFPDALFVYVYRDPRESLISMMDAWESGRAVAYPQLPDWEGPPWSLLLVEGWRDLRGKDLAEIVVAQWSAATRTLLDDLEELGPERWCVAARDELVRDPQREVERLCGFLGIEWNERLPSPLRLARHADAPSDPETRQSYAAKLEPLLPQTVDLARRARDWFAQPPSTRRKVAPPPAMVSPLRSVHTANLPAILDQLGASLLVTTYQTGKLICARYDEGKVNTHFRNFEMPMGLALHGNRIALGTRSQVWEYQNVPAAATKLEPRGKFDACFVPRRSRYTGDVRIHEVAYAGGELWIVATRFSCLATMDEAHSFVPRWRPPFVTALRPEDRCHLNGLAVIDDRVAFVTALGETDEPGGWRENKASGGLLIDVESGEVVVRGLSMPHSPRRYRDRLWLLESGEGTLATVDLEDGSVETVAQLPGFTRGLAFAGPLAFIGLSQIRETATFGGLPISERLNERLCGVWVVNIENGTVVGFLRFEELVQEIFEVIALPRRFPEIAEHGSDLVNLSYILPDADVAAMREGGGDGVAERTGSSRSG